ncbi:MAG: ABC transporter ATP-binding protein, partial [Clostridiales bacterium]|nr:ABC transporter ATP-binding protein [Clostridiales bacterium]
MEKKQAASTGANPRRPKSVRKSFGRLLHYFGAYKWRVILAILCMLVFVFGSVFGTYLLKPIFNSLENVFKNGIVELGSFVQNLVLLAVLYALSAIASYLSPRIMLPVSTGILLRLRRDMFSHLQKLPVKYFDTYPHGEVMSRFTNDTDALREMLGNALPVLMGNVVQVAAILVAMFILSWHLTLVVLVFFGMMLLIANGLSKKSAQLFRRRMATMGRANGFMEEYIDGQREVQLFNHERRACRDFEPLAEELRKDSTGATAYAIVLMPIMGNLNYVLYTAVAAVGVLMLLGQFGLAAQTAMNIGTIAAFLQYSRQFSQPISQISMQWNVILNALAGTERIFVLMDEAPEVDEGDVTLIHDSEGLRWLEGDGTERLLCGDVRFENVTFGYNEGQPVLHNLSLYAKPGQKIAFVGSTGAGKTTIT